jgi:hypothetical protein
MPLPISIKEFVKDPVKSLLFLTICAILYLYIDNKMMYTTLIEKQDNRIMLLENKVDDLYNKLNSKWIINQ